MSAKIIPFTTVNEIADAVYANAVEKGFHPPEESRHLFVEQMCNNMHDEISELHEAHRAGKLDEPCDKSEKMIALGLPTISALEEELADEFIRVLDNARHLKVDILRAVQLKHAYNRTREYRHGGKNS